MRQKGCSFVTLRPLRNRGLILFREVNESKWTPEASALSRCNFLRFCQPNPAVLAPENVDASGVQKRSFTSWKSIRPRDIDDVRERQLDRKPLVLLCREHEPNFRMGVFVEFWSGKDKLDFLLRILKRIAARIPLETCSPGWNACAPYCNRALCT